MLTWMTEQIDGKLFIRETSKVKMIALNFDPSSIYCCASQSSNLAIFKDKKYHQSLFIIP